MKTAKIAAACLAAVVLALPAFSQNLNEREVFDVSVRGLDIGFIGYIAKNNGSRYSLGFGVRSTGILDLFQNVEIDASANGRVVDGELFPYRYEENSILGKKSNRVVIEYENGVPNLVVKEPPIDESKPLLDPLEQVGTLDPLSSLYMIFRSSVRNELCDKEFYLFDGERRARISLGKPTWNGDEAICDCVFVRMAGYSESELEGGKEFPFTISFDQSSEDSLRYKFRQLEGKSRYGSIRIERR